MNTHSPLNKDSMAKPGIEPKISSQQPTIYKKYKSLQKVICIKDLQIKTRISFKYKKSIILFTWLNR